MIGKLAHIGIAVKDLTPVATLYRDVLGLTLSSVDESEDLRWIFVPLGETALEFIQSKGAHTPIARFVSKHGEGIHHIALEVDDIEAALGAMKERGVPLIDETPRVGAHGSRIAFIHPKATQGVLIELVEPARFAVPR